MRATTERRQAIIEILCARRYETIVGGVKIAIKRV